jgi:hypothetical protein
MTFEEYAAWRLPAPVRYAAVLTGNRDLAQDIVQEVLARAHRQWRRIGRLDAPDAYVRRMITNEFLWWRRWGRVVPTGRIAEDQRPTWAAEQPDPATVHAEREALLAEIARLPRRQQAVPVRTPPSRTGRGAGSAPPVDAEVHHHRRVVDLDARVLAVRRTGHQARGPSQPSGSTGTGQAGSGRKSHQVPSNG